MQSLLVITDELCAPPVVDLRELAHPTETTSLFSQKPIRPVATSSIRSIPVK